MGSERLRRALHQREGCSENPGFDLLEDSGPYGVLQSTCYLHTCAHDHAVDKYTEKNETTGQHSAYFGWHRLRTTASSIRSQGKSNHRTDQGALMTVYQQQLEGTRVGGLATVSRPQGVGCHETSHYH